MKNIVTQMFQHCSRCILSYSAAVVCHFFSSQDIAHAKLNEQKKCNPLHNKTLRYALWNRNKTVRLTKNNHHGKVRLQSVRVRI